MPSSTVHVPTRAFGRKNAVADTRVPRFSMVTKRLIKPPPSCNWFAAVGEWKMLANDNYSCCVESAAFHALLQFSTYASRPINPTDVDVLDFYAKSAGYVPGDPTTDNGSYVLGPTGALPYWHDHGIMVNGKVNKLTAFLQATLNPEEWKQAVFTFGGAMIGLNLPDYIVASPDIPYVWDVLPGKGNAPIVGGHEVWVDGYMNVVNEDLFEFVSWGERFRMTKTFMLKYVDEVAVLYNHVAMNKLGMDARGLPESELLALMSGMNRIA